MPHTPSTFLSLSLLFLFISVYINKNMSWREIPCVDSSCMLKDPHPPTPNPSSPHSHLMILLFYCLYFTYIYTPFCALFHSSNHLSFKTRYTLLATNNTWKYLLLVPFSSKHGICFYVVFVYFHFFNSSSNPFYLQILGLCFQEIATSSWYFRFTLYW